VTCLCSKCPAKDTDKCPQKELKDRAYYFRELLHKQQKGKSND